MTEKSKQGEKPAGALADPIVTDPDKYKVVMENDRVRVLEYRDSPGQKTNPHFHPDFVLCSLSSFTRTLTLLPENRSVTREVRTGDVAWSEAHSHIGENVGKTETHVIIVELKEPLR